MKAKFLKLGIVATVAMLAGCASQEVPQAHKGRMFDKTGVWAFYVGGKGFEGPILNPGTHFTGLYPEIRMVDCSQRTLKESLTALTKDGVQFGLDIYVRYGANCDDVKSVETILEKMMPEGKQPQPKDAPEQMSHADPTLTITGNQMYTTYVRPALGEAMRESVSPYIANEVNAKREEIFARIRSKFSEIINKQSPKLVLVYDLNLSNLDFPDQLDKANIERAEQAVLKDKAIAEREKVTAEIETMKMKQQLVVNEAANDVARIDALGAAYKRNPEYTVLQMYEYAGAKGNMILTVPPPNVFVNNRMPTK